VALGGAVRPGNIFGSSSRRVPAATAVVHAQLGVVCRRPSVVVWNHSCLRMRQGTKAIRCTSETDDALAASAGRPPCGVLLQRGDMAHPICNQAGTLGCADEPPST